jgi:hypothetical protein
VVTTVLILVWTFAILLFCALVFQCAKNQVIIHRAKRTPLAVDPREGLSRADREWYDRQMSYAGIDSRSDAEKDAERREALKSLSARETKKRLAEKLRMAELTEKASHDWVSNTKDSTWAEDHKYIHGTGGRITKTIELGPASDFIRGHAKCSYCKNYVGHIIRDIYGAEACSNCYGKSAPASKNYLKEA